MFVALCFAEVGSRFETTGGAYLYTRAAFGRFAGFEVGWMQWVTRATSQASVVNGLALALGLGGDPAGRAAVITALTVALAAINVRGIRESSWVVNAFTIAKLLPLGVFIVVGIAFVDPDLVLATQPVSREQISTAALLLIFTFGGYDVVPVPAGESNAPRRHVPFALIATIVIVTIVMTLAQVVTMGTLPNLAGSATPMADAAGSFMGTYGVLMIAVGSVLSMTGNNAGQVLSGSRMLFALAENGELPRVLARVHPTFRTPSNAVLLTSAVALALALSGSFAQLAAVSAVARLVTYLGASSATLVLRQARFRDAVKPATFTAPMGPLIPLLAIAVSLVILVFATPAQQLAGLYALGAGAVLFIANSWFTRVRISAGRP
jgi:amino acid transporter